MTSRPPRRFSLFPTTLHKAAETAARPAFKQYGIVQARLTSDWRHIVGSVLVEKVLPISIRFPKGQRDNGTLYLAVAPGWALDIQHLEPVILEKIATYFGYRAIAKLHLIQRPLPFSPKKPVKPFSPVLSSTAQIKLETTTVNITDPALKAALQKLGEGIFCT